MTDTTGRVLLVGEDNPYGSDPAFALYCYPPGCAGYRLRRILGLPQHIYLSLHRKNLCDDAWSAKRARERAFELLTPFAEWKVLVLLGRKVTSTFEKVAFSGDPLEAFAFRRSCPGLTLVSLPHPSGRNLVWNQPWATTRAREILHEVAPEVPWGGIDAEDASVVREEA